ncbi:hypothetical protein BKI52_01435 [marine bacterium AO1-C]|nr:hypothetical protein BKI52_01435 [marine bacterium AO1-C]
MLISDKWFRRLGVPLIGIAAYYLQWIMAAFDPEPFNFTTLLYLTLLMVSLYEGNRKIIRYFQVRQASIAHFRRRLARQFFWTILYSLACVNLFYGLFKWYAVVVWGAPDGLTLYHLGYANSLGLILAVVVNSIQLMLYFTNSWQEERLAKEQLQKENLKSQLTAVKQQINPHFLFNSFNVLAELIDIDPQKAKKFVAHFSEIYHYVLNSRDLDVTTLQEELQFLDSFLYLLKQRYTSGLMVELEIDEASKKYWIPPMVLQLLLENAIKHNIISRNEPLQVEIKTEGDWLLVRNNLQLRENKAVESTKTGLQNIQTRYQALSDLQPVITCNSNFFEVKLPLLQVDFH